jgi:hypothetical protein
MSRKTTQVQSHLTLLGVGLAMAISCLLSGPQNEHMLATKKTPLTANDIAEK